MNLYGYCWNDPIGIVDIVGNLPDWVKTALKVTACVGIAAVGAAAVVVTCGAAAPAIAAIAAGTISATTVGTVVAAGAVCGGVSCLTCQSMEMVMGTRKSIDNSAMVGSMVGGGAMGLMGSACTSLGTTMMAGGISSATGDIATQAYRTKGGQINAGEVATAAAGGALLAGAGYGLATAVSSPRGSVTVSEDSCLLETGGKPDYYVRPNGETIPSTGYRYISENAPYLDSMLDSMIIPANDGGTYFSFNRFETANPGALQVPHDASVRVEFDTLQITDDINIPYGNWGKASYLEPITVDFPQFGAGGATQVITNSEIIIDSITKLPK